MGRNNRMGESGMRKEDKIRIVKKFNCLDQHHLNLLFLTVAMTYFEVNGDEDILEETVDKLIKEQEDDTNG